MSIDLYTDTLNFIKFSAWLDWCFSDRWFDLCCIWIQDSFYREEWYLLALRQNFRGPSGFPKSKTRKGIWGRAGLMYEEKKSAGRGASVFISTRDTSLSSRLTTERVSHKMDVAGPSAATASTLWGSSLFGRKDAGGTRPRVQGPPIESRGHFCFNQRQLPNGIEISW